MTAAQDAADGLSGSPSWREIAERLQAERRAGAGGTGVDQVDPADFDLDEDCCLGGCCEKGVAYLAAVERAAPRRPAG